MGVNIKIPILEDSGETPISIFNRLHFIAKTVTDYLIAQKGDYVLNNPVSFLLKLGKNFLNVAESFINVVVRGKDSNSAFALFRVQADYLATLLLIFEDKDEDETRFRYLLYLIDGLTQRAESLEALPACNKDISESDYNSLVKQMIHAKENAQDMLDFCYNEIHKHPYKSINQGLFDQIVHKKQWRYKAFNDCTHKCECLKWKDLYSLIDSRTDVASFISLCSHNVHGSINSLLSDTGDEIFDPIVNFNAVLIERYISMLKSLYGKTEFNKILEFCLFGVTLKICQ